MGSDNRIAAARKVSVARELDTDKELPVSRDTWPGTFEDEAPTKDTIPTPPPSSGAVEHVTIPAMPAVNIDE